MLFRARKKIASRCSTMVSGNAFKDVPKQTGRGLPQPGQPMPLPLPKSRISPEAREKGRSALFGLSEVISGLDARFHNEKRFMESLRSLEQTIASLLDGTEPSLREYSKNDISKFQLGTLRGINVRFELSDGKARLSPELESVIHAALYMLNEGGANGNGSLRIVIMKAVDGKSQSIYLRGQSMKGNMGREVRDAISAAASLMGHNVAFNGNHILLTMPIEPVSLKPQ